MHVGWQQGHPIETCRPLSKMVSRTRKTPSSSHKPRSDSVIESVSKSANKYIGNTERALLDGMKAFDGLEVERGVVAVALDIDERAIHDPQAHAIKLTVQHLTDEDLAASSTKQTIPQPGDFNYNPADEPYLKRKVTGKEGSTEIINARFVIGADGSRSWTRNALGFDFVGDDDNADEGLGGILDCIATSNFRTPYFLLGPLANANNLYSGHPHPIRYLQGWACGGICTKGERAITFRGPRG